MAETVRLPELLASLSLAVDMGMGLPMETMLRTTLVATRLATAAGCSSEDAVATYQLVSLRFVGCTTTSFGDSFIFGGDELGVADLLVADDGEMAAGVERAVGRNLPEPERSQAVARFFEGAMSGAMAAGHRMHCEAAAIIASRLELGPAVIAALPHVYERWDGRGSPNGVAGEAISLPMRIVHVATIAAYPRPGMSSTDVGRIVASRAGRQLDPRLARLFADNAGEMLAGIDGPDLQAAALAAEPGVPVLLSGDDLDRGLTALADFGDFKSPHMLGHSRRVSALAEAAARAASMPPADLALVRRVGLIHDIGRVGVQAQLLSKTGPLSAAERERIRLHTYLTERLFAASETLAPIGAIGAMHHERLDASGYHRGLTAPMLPATARLLAAANTWCALTEARPHRPIMTEGEASAELSRQAKSGELDARAVEAVLAAAGQRPRQVRRAAAIALSAREIEVLRLIARQQTTRQIANRLDISPKTVERHVTHVYDKLGVTTRAGAALYAAENGLL